MTVEEMLRLFAGKMPETENLWKLPQFPVQAARKFSERVPEERFGREIRRRLAEPEKGTDVPEKRTVPDAPGTEREPVLSRSAGNALRGSILLTEKRMLAAEKADSGRRMPDIGEMLAELERRLAIELGAG